MTMIELSRATSMEAEEEKEKLPLDLIYEVLTWCDVNALASHRLACKKWCSLLSNSHFINLHLQRTKTLRGFFLHPSPMGRRSNPSFVTQMLPPPPAMPSLDFLPDEYVMIVASTGGQAGHGLLCCVDQCIGSHDFYVCKPTTREWTLIPRPHKQYSTIKNGMGMGVVTMGNPPVFKIVRLCKFIFQERSRTYHAEVFNSAKWEWELLPPDALAKFGELGSVENSGLLINSSLYWLIVPLLPEDGVARVVSFEIQTNELSEVSLPETFVLSPEAGKPNVSAKSVHDFVLKLVNMGGDLAFVCKSKTQIDVWVMSSKKNQVWTKKESLRLEKMGRKTAPLVLGFFAADVALVIDKNIGSFLRLQWYNYINNNYMEAREKVFLLSMGEPHFFQSDYVPCNIGVRQCGFRTKFPSSSNSYTMKKPRPHLWQSVGRTRRAS